MSIKNLISKNRLSSDQKIDIVFGALSSQEVSNLRQSNADSGVTAQDAVRILGSQDEIAKVVGDKQPTTSYNLQGEFLKVKYLQRLIGALFMVDRTQEAAELKALDA